MPPSVQVEDFEGVRCRWQEILPACSTNTVFMTPWWQQTWWRHFGEGSELHVLSLRDNGATLGIAPLRLNDGVLSFIGDTDLCDYQDFLVPRGREDAFYSAVWDHLLTARWDALVLRSIPQGSPTLQSLSALARRDGYQVDLQEEDKAPVALLPSTWDEYLSGLTKKGRHELRRKMRRLENAGESRDYGCTSPEGVRGGMSDFFRLLRANSPEKAEFLTPQRERFFMDAATELAAREQLRLSFLELDGVRVAVCMIMDYGDAYLLYNSGYDPGYAHLSVGLLNKAFSVKYAIEEGKSSYEFLRGNERYKYDLGGKDRSVFQLIVSR